MVNDATHPEAAGQYSYDDSATTITAGSTQERESSFDEQYSKILTLDKELMKLRDYFINKSRNDIDWYRLLVNHGVDRELAEFFGDPIFEIDENNNPIHGSELNEYGLQAAYSLLGVSNRAWVVPLNFDLIIGDKLSNKNVALHVRAVRAF